MSRYPEAIWRPVSGAQTGTYYAGPARLVIHTIEGRSIAGAEATYRAKGVVPHFTGDPIGRQLVQHVDTSRSASALANPAGGVQTNRAGRVIQIELVGYADESHTWPDSQLAWIGRIILLICQREGIDPRRHPAFVGREAGTIATPTARQRFSPAAWSTFAGVCGHQHVPENSHWDPGRFNIDRALQLANPTPTGALMALTDKEQDELLRHVRFLAQGAPTYGVEPVPIACARILWTLGGLNTDHPEGKPSIRDLIVKAGQAPPQQPVTLTPADLTALASQIVERLGAPLAGTLASLLAARLAE